MQQDKTQPTSQLDGHLPNREPIEKLEMKFQVLAKQFRRFMNFYGLVEDVNLLLVDTNYNNKLCETQQNHKQANDTELACLGVVSCRESGRDNVRRVARKGAPQHIQRGQSSGRAPLLDYVARVGWLTLVVVANSFTLYMLVAHFIWELLRLDAKMSTYSDGANQQQQQSNGIGIGPDEGQQQQQSVANTLTGWSVLKDFIENLRRHLSRLCALGLILIWHKNCHKLELLFVDCRRYYAAFYPNQRDESTRQMANETTRRRGHSTSNNNNNNNNNNSFLVDDHHQQRTKLFEAASRFYTLAWRRIWLGISLPFVQLALNVLGVILSPRALVAAHNGKVDVAEGQGVVSLPFETDDSSGWPLWRLFQAVDQNQGDQLGPNKTANSLMGKLLNNFEFYHRATHTAFHSFNHQIDQLNNHFNKHNSTSSLKSDEISATRSALYSLLELSVHYVYISGPRQLCATCLSLIFSIHHQCLCAFNEQLVNLIRRPRQRPLERFDMVKLLKQYDMISMMHERIERTFKWSLISWFSQMFISCLMLIYTLTESTSTALSSNVVSTGLNSGSSSLQVPPMAMAAAAAAASKITTTTMPLAQDYIATASTSVNGMSAENIVKVFTFVCSLSIILMRIFMVCYAPLLIYAEAFKIERENLRASQLILLLSRRDNDPVAQSIEPSLFEPIQLSVGGYFSLSKHSVAPLLGAIVTFSIMFMAGGKASAPANSPDDIGPGDAESSGSERSDSLLGRQSHPERQEEEPADEQLELYESNDDDDGGGGRGALSRGDELELGPMLSAGRLGLGLAERTTMTKADVWRPIGLAGPSPSSFEAGQKRKHRRPSRRIAAVRTATRKVRPEEAADEDKKEAAAEEDDDVDEDDGDGHEDGDDDDDGDDGEDGEEQDDELELDGGDLSQLRPKLAAKLFVGTIKENERLVSVKPKLRVENGAEICDFELRPTTDSETTPQSEPESGLASRPTRTTDDQHDRKRRRPPQTPTMPFVVSWINRIQGEVTIEAADLSKINCERKQNYTMRVRAIGCNGLESNEALLRIELEDVNEFRPEFERNQYTVSMEVERLAATATASQKRHGSALKSSELASALDESDDGDPLQQQQQQQQQRKQAGRTWCHLLTVRAHDQDCSREFGQVCHYELVESNEQHVTTSMPTGANSDQQPTTQNTGRQLASNVRVDSGGNLEADCLWLLQQARQHHNNNNNNHHHQQQSRNNSTGSISTSAKAHHHHHQAAALVTFQVVAFDCGGKKSQNPASVQVELLDHLPEGPRAASAGQTSAAHCRAGWKDLDTQIAYAPASAERWPFQRARLDLCSAKCHRPNITVKLQLRANPLAGPTPIGTVHDNDNERQAGSVFHCDRDPYAMVSKRRLCGARQKTIELLPPLSTVRAGGGGGNVAQHPMSWLWNDVGFGNENDEQEAQDDGQQRELTQPTTANDDEENLGAYLPDGSYGRLASEFAARMKQSQPSLSVQQATKREQDERMHATRLESGDQFLMANSRKVAGAIYRDQVYHFDGLDDALSVPSFVLNENNNNLTSDKMVPFGSRHTISFWMRHGQFKFKISPKSGRNGSSADELVRLSKHVREHVLCASDRPIKQSAQSMKLSSNQTEDDRQAPNQEQQRHSHLNHYTIYLRNCKLNLLIRNDKLTRRRQLEWRWSLDQYGNQFCDNKWHLYTLNVFYPNQVELFVDGQQFNNEKKPANLLLSTGLSPFNHLKQSTRNQNSKSTNSRAQVALTVGACYEARSRSMVGHFRGSLSGLSVLVNANDDTNTIECLGRCTESLVSMAPQKDQQRQRARADDQQQQHSLDHSLVSYQEAQDRIELRGHNLVDIEEALAQIAYVNKRQLPSVGRRTIELSTELSCQMPHQPIGHHQQYTPDGATTGQQHDHQAGGEHWFQIPIEPLSVSVNVLPSTSLPQISLSGTLNLAREHLPFIQGKVAPFESLRLQVRQLSLLAETAESKQMAPPKNLSPSTGTSDLLDYIDDGSGSGNGPNSTRSNDEQQQQQQVSLEASEDLVGCRRRIESCHVHLDGATSSGSSPQDKLYEGLVLPVDQLTKLNLYWRQSKWAALIYGLDTAENYETLLRSILYKNQRPAQASERLFRLTCSDMSGRLLSNQYVQKLTMIHPKPRPTTLAANSTTRTQLADRAAGLELDGDKNGSRPLFAMLSAGPAEDRRYDSLRWQAPETLSLHRTDTSGELYDLDSSTSGRQQQIEDTKFNRMALAFIVFLVSAVLVVLVIALINLRGAGRDEEEAVAAAAARRKRRTRRQTAARRLERRPQQFEFEELNSLPLVRRRRQCAKSISNDTDDGAENGEEFDEDELERVLSSQSDEFTSETSSVGDDFCDNDDDDHDDATIQHNQIDCPEHSGGNRSLGRCGLGRRCSRPMVAQAAVSPRSEQSSIEMESLAWDDDDVLAQSPFANSHQNNSSHQSTRIVANPMLQHEFGQKQMQFSVASIEQPQASERPQTRLVCNKTQTDEEVARGLERNSMIIDELIPMDDSVCSRSRSCSISSVDDDDDDDEEDESQSCLELDIGRDRRRMRGGTNESNLEQRPQRAQTRWPQLQCLPCDRHHEDNEEEDDEENDYNLQGVQSEPDEFDESETDKENKNSFATYELYHDHLHHHHHHHQCLRAQQRAGPLIGPTIDTTSKGGPVSKPSSEENCDCS